MDISKDFINNYFTDNLENIQNNTNKLENFFKSFSDKLDYQNAYLKMENSNWSKILNTLIFYVEYKEGKRFIKLCFEQKNFLNNKKEILSQVDCFLYSCLANQESKEHLFLLELIFSVCDNNQDIIDFINYEYFGELVIRTFFRLNKNDPKFTLSILDKPYFHFFLNHYEKLENIEHNKLINSFKESNSLYIVSKNISKF